LKMLEAEAESSMEESEPEPELEPESKESQRDVSKSEQKSDLILDKKELIDGVADFEKALKKEYPESYKMYSQFNEEQKKTAYNHFTKRKRLYNTNLKIISIYLHSN